VQPNCSATVSKSKHIHTTDDGDAVLKNALDKGNTGELNNNYITLHLQNKFKHKRHHDLQWTG
jgi:hypothetical protein